MARNLHRAPPPQTPPSRHPCARPARHGGFTLIEMVLTLLILGIIAAVVSQFALQGIRSYSTEQDRGGAHSQARLAMERVVREARGIRSCTPGTDLTLPPGNPFDTLTFTDTSGATVTFSVAGGNLLRGASVLAQGVTAVSSTPFRLLDRTGAATLSCTPPNDIWFVEIDLTCTEGSASLHLRSRVHPRNF